MKSVYSLREEDIIIVSFMLGSFFFTERKKK